MHPIRKMVSPNQRRPGIWLGGIIQIMVTRACNESCCHCTQGSNLAGKPVVMKPDEFAQAVDSLQGYFGVYGCFGGNPCTSPYFDDYCAILRAKVPFQQRGLWTNHPMGKGVSCRITFNPAHSNLNVHMDHAAYDELVRDWPECVPYIRGRDQDSLHSSPWVAIKDVVPDEARMWDMISNCDINKFWSALIGVVPGRGLRAYFCELAYTQAALHADDPDWPDVGMPVVPGWWKQPIETFETQIRQHCPACGIPLRRQGVPAIGGKTLEYTETHASIARPKRNDHQLQVIAPESLAVTARPATEYLDGTTPGYRPNSTRGTRC